MADVNFYNVSELACGVGIQGHSIDRTAAVTAATPEITLAYIQSFRVTPNENITAHKFINSGNGANITKFIKGMHECNLEFSFWIPKDLDQTTPMEIWLLKQAFDGSHSVTQGTPDIYVVPDDTNEYGSNYLNCLNFEIGYNKTDNIIRRIITGAIMNRATFHFEREQPVLVTFNMDALKCESAVSAFTSLVEASEEPFVWGDTSIAYGDAAGSAAQNNINRLTINIEYVKKKVADLANATSTRTGTGWVISRRKITGDILFDLTTETDNGQDLWEDYYNDASGTASPTEGVTLKDLFVTLYQDATYDIVIELHDLVLTGLPEDVVGEGVPNVTVPFTAKAGILKFKTLGTSTPPTNF
jgi:hypothetical protein